LKCGGIASATRVFTNYPRRYQDEKAPIYGRVGGRGDAVLAAGTAFGDDIELAKKSTIEEILKNGELRVGFESGYMPFEMTDKTGAFVGFDIDIAKEMAKAMNVKFVPVNTAWTASSRRCSPRSSTSS